MGIKCVLHRVTLFCSILSALLLSGCMVGPNFTPLPPPATEHYTSLPLPNSTVSADNSNAGKSQQFAFNRDIQGDWWHIFHSPALNALVSKGISNNANLAAAKAALRSARYTLFAQAGGLLFPSVNFGTNAQRSQTNGLSFGVPNATNIFDVFNASFQASYLLDIWGASRRQIESYAAQVDYQRYEMLATYLTLTTNIVTTAITVASLRDQISATQQLIDEEQKILTITQQQYAVGGVSEQNVLTQQTQLAQTIATLPPLKKSLSQQQHALAVLVGERTDQFKPLSVNLAQLNLPAQLPVSLPSAMVQQRPDVQAASALLHEASAQIGIATANLLPQITLTASYGWLSQSTVNLFDHANRVWSLASGLLQPLVHGGQLINQRRSALAAFDQAKAQYKQTVLQSFQNVADALRAIQYDAATLREQVQAEKSAASTLRLTEQQYQVGGQNYLAVLNAQQQYEQIVLKKIQAQAARYSDTAGLYQALGGGWWHATISQYGALKQREIYH